MTNETASAERDVPPATPALQWAAILALPVLALLVGGVFLPRPAGVEEERATLDRSALKDVVSKVRPTPNSPVDAVLGTVRVLGADLPQRTLSRGDKLGIKLYYETLGTLTRDWTVFVHIDARGAEFRIHGDHPPALGRFPTTLWEKGDFIVDPLDKSVPLDAPAGTYDVWIGFYVGDERLPFTSGDRAVHDGVNRIKVGTITVE